MSQAELVGLMLTAAVLAAGLGAVAGILLAKSRSARAQVLGELTKAYSRWLAARWRLSRTSISFVAAFRALEAERAESSNYRLREREAQRARARWSHAVDELDGAEAEISARAFGVEPPPRTSPMDPDELRAAIQGDGSAFRALRLRLQWEDAQAAERVRVTLERLARPRSVWRTAMRTLGAFFGRIAEGWTR